ENERRRRWIAANPEAYRASQARRKYPSRKGRPDHRVRTPEERRKQQLSGKHGMSPEQRVELWEHQGRCCYLCGRALPVADAVIDHDHRCCPPKRSCSSCRRGLACGQCNTLIAWAADNPDVLRTIAANLETALASVTARLAVKPRQLMFDESA